MLSPVAISTLANWYVNTIKTIEEGTEESYTMMLLIDQWSDDTKIAVRAKLELWGCKKLSRNLYYNYQVQKWI